MPTDTTSIQEVINLTNSLATINLGYLGLAITILTLFGGAFYLFNFKPIKDKLENQEKVFDGSKKELEDNVASLKEKLEVDFDNFKKNQDSAVLNLVSQRDDKLLAEIQTKIVTFENEFTEKFNSFADEKDVSLKTIILAEVSNKIGDLEKSVTARVSGIKAENEKANIDIKKTISSLQDGFKELKIKSRELEVFMYSQKGQMGAIYGSIDLLKYAIDEDSWRIDGSLENLNKEMGEVKLEGEIVTRIEEQLVRLDSKPKYSPLVAKVRKHYQE